MQFRSSKGTTQHFKRPTGIEIHRKYSLFLLIVLLVVLVDKKMCRLHYTADAADNLLAVLNNHEPYHNTSSIASTANQDACAQFQTGYRDGLNEFSSPNFPEKYHPKLDCVRVIQAPPGYDILINFKDAFHIEAAYEEEKELVAGNSSTTLNCPNDYLEIRDGRYPFSALLVRLCGRKIPSFEIRARSGFCWLHFHTDDLLEYNGFLASHEFVRSNNVHALRAECHLSFALPLDGYVNISVFREFYLKHREPTSSLDCVWHVQVPKWLQVAIFVEEFELASPNQCHENFLEIYAGQISPNPLKRYCGSATHVYTGQSIVFLRLFAIGAAQVLASHVRILFSTYVPLKNCSEQSLFSCGDDVCIPYALVCNGNSNCLYRKDEDHCEKEKNIIRWILSGYYFELVVVISAISLVVVGLCVWYKPCKGNQELIDTYLKQFSQPPPPHSLTSMDLSERTNNDDDVATLAGLQTNSLFNEIASETSSSFLAEKQLWEDGDVDRLKSIFIAPHHSNCRKYKLPASILTNGSCQPNHYLTNVPASNCTDFSSADKDKSESSWAQRLATTAKTVRIVQVPEQESRAMQQLEECLRSESRLIHTNRREDEQHETSFAPKFLSV